VSRRVSAGYSSLWSKRDSQLESDSVLKQAQMWSVLSHRFRLASDVEWMWTLCGREWLQALEERFRVPEVGAKPP